MTLLLLLLLLLNEKLLHEKAAKGASRLAPRDPKDNYCSSKQWGWQGGGREEGGRREGGEGGRREGGGREGEQEIEGRCKIQLRCRLGHLCGNTRLEFHLTEEVCLCP